MTAEPLDELTHDHAHMSRLVAEARDLVQTVGASPGDAQTRAALGEALESLLDDLATHFAREEEGLFPFVAARLPESSARLRGLTQLHDGLCGALGRMLRQLDEPEPEKALAAMFERFEVSYAEHSHEERDLIAALPKALSGDDLAELRGILESL